MLQRKWSWPDTTQITSLTSFLHPQPDTTVTACSGWVENNNNTTEFLIEPLQEHNPWVISKPYTLPGRKCVRTEEKQSPQRQREREAQVTCAKGTMFTGMSKAEPSMCPDVGGNQHSSDSPAHGPPLHQQHLRGNLSSWQIEGGWCSCSHCTSP